MQREKVTDTEIIRKNIIIAKLAGGILMDTGLRKGDNEGSSLIVHNLHPKVNKWADELNFHKDWNALMYVVMKIMEERKNDCLMETLREITIDCARPIGNLQSLWEGVYHYAIAKKIDDKPNNI